MTYAKKQDGKFVHDDDKLSDSGTQINKHAAGTREMKPMKKKPYYIFLSFLISCDGSDKTNWSALFPPAYTQPVTVCVGPD